jgi:ribosomal protein S3AE
MSRINIEITDELHQKLRIISAINSVSIKEFVLEAVNEKINSQIERKQKNAPLQTTNEGEIENEPRKLDNIADIFEDLGLN